MMWLYKMYIRTADAVTKQYIMKDLCKYVVIHSEVNGI